MVPPILTLVAAILGILAVALIPGAKAINEGDTERFKAWGKGAAIFLGVLVLAVGAYVFWDWYSGDRGSDLFVMANMAVLTLLGIAVIGNSAYTTIRIRKEEAEEVVEVVTIIEEVAPGPVKKKKKKVTKKAGATKRPKGKVKRPAKKKATKPKVVKAKKMIKKVKAPPEEELIPEEPEPARSKVMTTCPSCDSPLDHGHDECPVCGENIRG